MYGHQRYVGAPLHSVGCVIAVHLFGGMGIVDDGAPFFIHAGTFLLDGIIFSIGRTFWHASDYPPSSYTLSHSRETWGQCNDLLLQTEAK